MDRKFQYKHHQETAENLRCRRRCTQNELRREKREQVFSGKRMRLGEDDDAEYDITTADVINAAQKLLSKSDDLSAQLKLLRQAFAQGTALIDAFISIDNSLSSLVNLLTGPQVDLQLDAAWCLTNMAAGTDEHAMLVITNAGAYLVTFLSSANVPLQDQCAWAIGNLAGGNDMCRETLTAQGAVHSLIRILKSPASCVVRSSAFALSNLARGKHIQQLMVEQGILSDLARLLVFSLNNLDVITEAAWIMTYIAASGDYGCQIQSTGIPDLLVSIVIQLSDNENDYFQVLTPVQRCLGNIVCGLTDEQALLFCDNKQFFPTFVKILSSEHMHLRKEALWVLSNITALSSLCHLVVEAGLVPCIVRLLSDIFDIRSEALFCLCNMASSGAQCCRELFQQGALVCTIPVLKISDVETVRMGLNLVQMILNHIPEGVHQFEENHGVDALELHEYSPNDVLRQLTNDILEKHIYKDDDES